MSEPSRQQSGSASDEALIERIDALLPQTQCTRCGYAGCRPYARALARGEAAINRCPPGGERGIMALGALLGREPLPLDPECGGEEDPGVVHIDPQACIGCARCLPACPVDAIIGAHRHLHGVYEPECTGCRLCLASCPVDCISVRPRAAGQNAPAPQDNRRRFEARQARRQHRADERAALLQQVKHDAHTQEPADCP